MFCCTSRPTRDRIWLRARHVMGGEGVKVMGKAEIALQLTLKALEESKVGLPSVSSLQNDNAKMIYEFYNEIFMNLQVDNPQ